MFFLCITIILSLFSTLHASQKHEEASLLVHSRSVSLQQDIDCVFSSLQAQETLHWRYNGSYYTDVAGLNTAQWLSSLLRQAAPQTTLSFMDLGAGNFKGLLALGTLIQEDQDLLRFMEENSLNLHLVGVSGENLSVINSLSPCGRLRIQGQGSVKIENIHHEVQRLKLPSSYAMVVANWTLIHLVDPVGTVDQVMHLLEDDGLFAFQGFRLALNDQSVDDPCVVYTQDAVRGITPHVNLMRFVFQCGPCLVRSYAIRDPFQIILEKRTAYTCPVSYHKTLTTSSLSGHGWDCYAKRVSHYVTKNPDSFVHQSHEVAKSALAWETPTYLYGSQELYNRVEPHLLKPVPFKLISLTD